MADVSNKVFVGGSIAHVVSGGSMAAAAFSLSTHIDNELVGTGNLSSFPRADVVLTYRPGSSTASTATGIELYRQDLNVGGVSTYDDNVPASSNSNKFMGVFQVPIPSLSTGTYYMTLVDVPLPGHLSDCRFFVRNALTNAIPDNGWDLTIFPKTDAAG